MEYFIMSKQAKLLAAMKSGNIFTAKQISASFGLKDPYAAVRNLREAGHCVYGNPATLYTGEQTTKFRLGTPSRRMVAIASRIVGADAFTR
jgi:hypothetical protein